jgi:hypothetical protein
MNFYKEKVMNSLNKISEEYNYFLFGNNSLKNHFVGSICFDSKFLIPSSYSKNELKNSLFTEVENFYRNIDFNKKSIYQKNYEHFDSIKSKIFSTGYGVIITGSDLMVLDIDNKWEFNELLNICPNIVNHSKFRRENTNNSYGMHLYYKKPAGFDVSGNIRKIKLKKEYLWVCGLNKKTFPSLVDTAHLFRNENYQYELVGHMDDITECPQVIIDKIIENESRYNLSSNLTE